MPFSGFPLAIGEWIYAAGYNQIQAAVAERYEAFGYTADSSQSATGDWITFTMLDDLWFDIYLLLGLAPWDGLVSWCDGDDMNTYPAYDFEDFCNAVNGDSSGSDFWTYAPVDNDWIYAATWNAMKRCVQAFTFLKFTPEYGVPTAYFSNYHDLRSANSYPASSDVDAEWNAAVSAWTSTSYSEQNDPWVVAGPSTSITRAAGPVYWASVSTYRTSEMAIVIPADFPAVEFQKVKIMKSAANGTTGTLEAAADLYDENDFGGNVIASFSYTAYSGETISEDDVQDLSPTPDIGAGGGTQEFSLAARHPDDPAGTEIDPDDYRPGTPTSNATWRVSFYFHFDIDGTYYTPKPEYGFLVRPNWGYT